MDDYGINEIKAANEAAGRFFFSDATMRFFDSEVEPDTWCGPGGVYFVTSERFDETTPRCWTVRQFYPLSGEVSTVGGFQAYLKREDAEKAAGLLSAGSAEVLEEE